MEGKIIHLGFFKISGENVPLESNEEAKDDVDEQSSNEEEELKQLSGEFVLLYHLTGCRQ